MIELACHNFGAGGLLAFTTWRRGVRCVTCVRCYALANILGQPSRECMRLVSRDLFLPEPLFPSPRHKGFRPLPVKTQPARPSSNPCKPKLNQPSGGRSNAARGRAHQEVRSPRKHAGSPLRSRTTAEASCSPGSAQPAHTSGVGASTEASPSF